MPELLEEEQVEKPPCRFEEKKQEGSKLKADATKIPPRSFCTLSSCLLTSDEAMYRLDDTGVLKTNRASLEARMLILASARLTLLPDD